VRCHKCRASFANAQAVDLERAAETLKKAERTLRSLRKRLQGGRRV